jgi:hypothetical protein
MPAGRNRRQIGGAARGYQDFFGPLAAWQSRLRTRPQGFRRAQERRAPPDPD